MRILFARGVLPIGLLWLAPAVRAQIAVTVSSLVIDDRKAGEAVHPGDRATLAVNTVDGALCTPGVGGRSGGNNVKNLSSVSRTATGGSASWRWQVPLNEKVPVTWTITVSCLKGGTSGRDKTSLSVIGP